MHTAYRVNIESVCPALMHNGIMADPTAKMARALKELTSKRKKTDEDYDEIAKTELLGGLFLDGNGDLCWPAANIRAMLRDAGKSYKLGKEITQSVLVPYDSPLDYKGPDDVEDFWDAGMYDQRLVKVGTSKTLRTRPKIDKWSCEFRVLVDHEFLNENDFRRVVEIAGYRVGLGDYRPQFGRFEMVDFARLDHIDE